MLWAFKYRELKEASGFIKGQATIIWQHMGLISVRGGTLFSCLNKNATDLPLTPSLPPPRPQSRRQKVINFMIVRNLRHCTVHVLFVHAVQNAFNLIGHFYINFIPLNRYADMPQSLHKLYLNKYRIPQYSYTYIYV